MPAPVPFVLLSRMAFAFCAVIVAFQLAACGPDDDDGPTIANSKSASPSGKSESAGIRGFTCAATKVVWLEGGKWELITHGKSRVRLMGLDTEDGGKPRDLIGTVLALSKPLIAPDGRSGVVSDRAKGRILQVDWKSGKVRDLAEGWASDVWKDPKSRRMWVYHRSGKGRTKDAVSRFPLDDPKAEETVWTKTATGHDGVPWTQLSADGKHHADAFPWNKGGMGTMKGQQSKVLGTGCWPGMSPDNSYRMFIFQTNHREVTMCDGGSTKGRKVDVSNIPGMKRKTKVYHPQWSNHPRFISLTAPERNDRNELYIGRFDKGFKSVEGWIQVTKNKRAESFSDVWIAP